MDNRRKTTDKTARAIRRGMKQENKEEIIRAVAGVWEQICPGYELVCISLPKEDVAERKRILEWILEAETLEHI